jgi:hypothetical protein
MVRRSKLDQHRDLRFFGISGSVRIFVDQAAQDGFSVDPFVVEVGNGAGNLPADEPTTVRGPAAPV